MGLLVDGAWRDQWYDTKASGGRFKRQESQFRNWVQADPSAPFPAESGRYHLYVSLACPWAHRTLIFRALKGLEDHIGVTVVDAFMGSDGWTLSEDPVNGKSKLYEVYLKADPSYTGRVTVPVLWDKRTETIVSNESADIIRMLNGAFDAIAKPGDFYPEALREEIETVNALVYDGVNNGVYKAGFATTPEAYEEAVTALFETLDDLEERLGQQAFLAGDQVTEADWRLFTTLVRFDAVYVGHFKCNLKMIKDYPNLWAYTRALYQVPGVRETVNFEQIKRHYYESHKTINPTGVVPLGPLLDWDSPHGRGSVLQPERPKT